MFQTLMKIRPDTDMQERKMLSVQNISDVAVTMKFDLDHKNCKENGKFTGDYPMAQFERSGVNIVQEGPKNKFS